jgi:glycosyltransferase involved in cell wall biosynthesis
MKVGIDITSVIYSRGVSRYTSNLARALGKNPEVELSLFGYSLRNKSRLERMTKGIECAQKKFLSYPPTMVDKFWRLGLLKVKNQLPNIEIFHAWDWIQPPDTDIPIVSTIHDLAILKFPDTAHPKILKAHKRAWKQMEKKQSRIIAVSRATKKDIVELLGYPAYMIDVVHEALPEEFRQTSLSITTEDELVIKNKLGLNKPFILFVGTREPRKNLVRLIEAWQDMSADLDLVVVGEAGWDESLNTAKKLTNQPKFVGKVTDKTLSVLYSLAEVFAYPSLYEGFGLPILESFHHGTPVLTSENSGMLEVAGNAAEFIDPLSVESIKSGLEKILQEDKQEQQKRLQRMIIRLQMFSWEKVARETIEVYNKALSDFEN